MKKFSILVVLLMVLCFCTSSYGAEGAIHEWYVGIGGIWALEDIDVDDVPGEAIDFDDGAGFAAKVGYHLNDCFSLALVFDYITGFDSDESVSVAIPGATLTEKLEAELDVWTLMLEGKASMSGTLSPYVVLGAGIKSASVDVDYTETLTVAPPFEDLSTSASWDDDEDDTVACGKVGLGVDWWATPVVTVGFEGAYVFGFSDADFDGLDVAIDYFTLGLGIAYHF